MSDKGEKVKKDAHAAPKKQVEPPDLLSKGQIIAAHSGKKYLVDFILGKGGFGEVHKVSLYKEPEKKFAMKVERNSMGNSKNSTQLLRLKVEIHVFEQIDQNKRIDRTHFVRMHDKGITDKFKYYVMDEIWRSLKEIWAETLKYKELSPSTLVQIARQTLASIRQLHELGFLHRDIKGHNFAVGLPPRDNIIYMLDFGIARPYRDSKGAVRVPRAKVTFMGTTKYASIRGMMNEDQSRADDLEAWLYMMIEFYDRTNILWIGKGNNDEILKCKKILMENPGEHIKRGIIKLPPYCHKSYRAIMETIHAMKYTDEPNYTYFDACLMAIVNAGKLDLSQPLDWAGMFKKDDEMRRRKREEDERKKEAETKPVRTSGSRSRNDDVDERESKKRDRKERRKESRKKKKKPVKLDDETLITMEEMLDQLKAEKKRRLRKKSSASREGLTEDDYWKSDEDEEELDDYEDGDDDEEKEKRKRRKKKSRKRKSREHTRTRDYSDRDEEDELYEDDNRENYDKTPHRPRKRGKRSSGGRKKKSGTSKGRKRTYEDEEEAVVRIPESKEPEEEDKDVKKDKDGKKKEEKGRVKESKKTAQEPTVEKPSKDQKSVSAIAPAPDDGQYVVLGDVNAMEKAQDAKDKEKKDKEKKEAEKKDEKPPATAIPEPPKKASEAAPAKKEPADAKKK